MENSGNPYQCLIFKFLLNFFWWIPPKFIKKFGGMVQTLPSLLVLNLSERIIEKWATGFHQSKKNANG